MGYVALYREWRPQRFCDIIGQEHISRTLQNAIRTNRIAHAYLFCGPRGTGKTTTAKVMAKTLNCLEASAGEPCNQCSNCLRVTEGTSMDVMEIDAASNRGIDEIRDLREKVKFAPSEGRYRIYIIDEVHMLTTEAFNALLKTLEEPPAHVIFVLATTEPHKIPLTILSRCQRFDFRRISLQDIVGRLRTVAESQKIEVQDEALTIIAKSAEGGMRDALSILDQCISFGGDKISVEDVNDVLGTVETELLFRAVELTFENDAAGVLRLIHELAARGKDLRVFAVDLMEFLRNLLLLEVSDGVDDLLPVTAENLAGMKTLAARLGKSAITGLIDHFSAAEREMKWTSQPRLVLELAFIKTGRQSLGSDYDALLARVARLEELLKNGVSREIGEFAADAAVGPRPLTSSEPQAPPAPESKGASGQMDQAPVIETETIRKCWQEILDRTKKVRMSAQAFLVEGKPVDVEGLNLILSFPPEYSFHKEKVEQAENRSAIEQVLREVTGSALKIKCTFNEEPSGSARNAKNRAGDDSLVEKARTLFGGDVIEVKD